MRTTLKKLIIKKFLKEFLLPLLLTIGAVSFISAQDIENFKKEIKAQPVFKIRGYLFANYLFLNSTKSDQTINAFRLDKHRTLSISHSSASYETDIVRCEEQLHQIVKGQVDKNKFITEFNYITNIFCLKHNIKSCLGYDPEVYTVNVLKNDPNAKN